MPHPPYSHLALRDFFLFPWIKKVLKGKVSADVEEVKQKKQKHKKASKSMSSKTVLSSGKKVDRCIASSGQYFEGD